jgi:hypothetical protein
MTQLREYSSALQTLKMQEWAALAEFHAKDPRLLIHRIRESIKTIAGMPAINEPFRETPIKGLPIVGPAIKRTPDLAAHIFGREQWEVAGAPDLAFRSVCREISPLRSQTTSKKERSARRSIDLLLENAHDHTLIVAEAKIDNDSPTYPALIQALMYAVEMATTAQLHRVREHLSAPSILVDPPRVDIYLIAIKTARADKPSAESEAMTNRERIDRASKTIAKRLTESPVVSERVRRIAFLNGATADGALKLSSDRLDAT